MSSQLHTSSTLVLAESEWQSRAAAHEARVAPWVDPHLARGKQGAKHPVYDFLFTYYPYRAAHLRRWHPGPDVVLLGAAARAFLRWDEYREVGDNRGGRNAEFGSNPAAGDADREAGQTHGVERGAEGRFHPGVSVEPATLSEKRREFLRWLRSFLQLTRERTPQFGCFGLHEWAMVYRQTSEEVRHAAWPLRMASSELAAFVESQAIGCTHFDAFRFFTPAARPLNRLQPTRETVPEFEQRGCLHANMDLYKWAAKLAPFTPSELLADCFELARDIRELDMRASPYDLRALGFAPVAIETPEGREEYVGRQREFSARGQPLRTRLLALTERLLRAPGAGSPD